MECQIRCRLCLFPRANEPDLSLLEEGQAICYCKGAFNIVGHHNRGDPQFLLDIANQSINTLRHYRIQTRCRLIIEKTTRA